MNYLTSIAYHDAYFEVEIVVPHSSRTKEEGEKIGSHPDLHKAELHHDKLVVGKGDKCFVVSKEETDLYQFRICTLTASELAKKSFILTEDDYQNVSWEEAMTYFQKTYANKSLPFSLESYYFVVYEEMVVFI